MPISQPNFSTGIKRAFRLTLIALIVVCFMVQDIERRLASPDGYHPLVQSDKPHVEARQIVEDIRLKQHESLFYRKLSYKVNPFKHKFILNGSRPSICDSRTNVIILVHSFHTYRAKRDAIRRTWGRLATGRPWPRRPISERISLAFVLGKNRNSSWDQYINIENDIYHDMIQGDFIDNYNNMTLKSLLGFKWVMQFCPSAKFLLKSDDDMFINLPYILKTLRTKDMRYSIMGPYNRGSVVKRSGKWGLSRETFPFSAFPPYESGSAYVISADLFKPIFETSAYVRHIHIDDVYITGIVGKIIGAKHVVRRGFAYWTSPKPKPCNIIQDDVYTGTQMTPANMYNLWKSISNKVDCVRKTKGPK